MNYNIALRDPISNNILRLHNGDQMCEATLSITYNYSKYFERLFGESGIRKIYGLRGYDSIPILEKAISELNNYSEKDWWEPTEDGVKIALKHLLILAVTWPSGIWFGN